MTEEEAATILDIINRSVAGQMAILGTVVEALVARGIVTADEFIDRLQKLEEPATAKTLGAEGLFQVRAMQAMLAKMTRRGAS